MTLQLGKSVSAHRFSLSFPLVFRNENHMLILFDFALALSLSPRAFFVCLMAATRRLPLQEGSGGGGGGGFMNKARTAGPVSSENKTDGSKNFQSRSASQSLTIETRAAHGTHRPPRLPLQSLALGRPSRGTKYRRSTHWPSSLTLHFFFFIQFYAICETT